MKTLARTITVFLLLFTIFFSVWYNSNVRYPYKNQQFIELSKGFLNGDTYFPDYLVKSKQVTDYDAIRANNHIYWPLGPLAAFIITPFVWISITFDIPIHQGMFVFVLFCITFYAVYKISRRIGFKNLDSSIFASAFCFGTSLLHCALFPNSWYFAQVLATTFLCLSIYEYFYKKRPLIIGLFVGLAMASRLTTGVSLIAFIILEILENRDNWKILRMRMSSLLLPWLLILIALFCYNYARFNSPFESGYNKQILYTKSLHNNRAEGLFSMKHLPGNIYHAFLATPTPILKDNQSHILVYPYIKKNPWGMSIFLISPFLLLLFGYSYKKRLMRVFLISSAIIAVPVFLFFGIGFTQTGFRYSLDFMPFLFTILMLGYKDSRDALSIKMQLLILFSIAFNFYINLI